MPEDFRVTLLEQATEDGVVYGSKAVGEPPLMLGFSVREALREAVAAFGPPGHCVDLGCPSTPEQVFWAVEAARAAAGAGAQESHFPATRPHESGFPATTVTTAGS